METLSAVNRHRRFGSTAMALCKRSPPVAMRPGAGCAQGPLCPG
jgi:hypothetical protein